MSYQYTVNLEIANEKQREDFNLTHIEEEIKASIAEYHSLDSVRNKKQFEYEVSPKVLTLHIDSPVELNVPSKAIAKFTRILLEKSEKLSKVVANGRVFQSILTQVAPSNIDNISNAETLKKLIDIFCTDTPEDVREANELLELQRKLKKIVFDLEESIQE